MKAIVVYQSLWGNTAAIAHAIAEGIGPEARALSTSEASADAVKDADLVVAGSPVLGFSLPNEKMIESIRANPGGAPKAPDLSQVPMRTWLGALASGSKKFAAFETRVKGPFGKATPAIEESMKKLGYEHVAEAQHFIVDGKFGPLKAGEIERARRWGMELAKPRE